MRSVRLLKLGATCMVKNKPTKLQKGQGLNSLSFRESLDITKGFTTTVDAAK